MEHNPGEAMANQTSGKGAYLIIGGLIVVVAVLAFLMFGPKDEPDVSISLGDQTLEIDTD